MRQLLPARMLRDCAAWLGRRAACLGRPGSRFDRRRNVRRLVSHLGLSARSFFCSLCSESGVGARRGDGLAEDRWPLRLAQRCSPSQCRCRTPPLDRAPCVSCTASPGPQELVPLRQVLAVATKFCRFHLLQKCAEAQTCSAGAIREPHVRRSVLAITYPAYGVW